MLGSHICVSTLHIWRSVDWWFGWHQIIKETYFSTLQKCGGTLLDFWDIWSDSGPWSFVCETFSLWTFVVSPTVLRFPTETALYGGLSLSIVGHYYLLGVLFHLGPHVLQSHKILWNCCVDDFLPVLSLSALPGTPIQILSFLDWPTVLFFLPFSNSEFLLCFLEISSTLSSNLFPGFLFLLSYF